MDIYRILVQFKIVCLFPLDFSVQNVLCKYTYETLGKSICKTCNTTYFSPGYTIKYKQKTFLNKFLQEKIICKGETLAKF